MLMVITKVDPDKTKEQLTNIWKNKINNDFFKNLINKERVFKLSAPK
jgi:hypothetical protein